MSQRAEDAAPMTSSQPTPPDSAPQPPQPQSAASAAACSSNGSVSDGSDSDDAAVIGSVASDWSTEYSRRPPPRLLRAEAVLAHRTSRIRLVLEQMWDSLNHQAVLRTAEALGVQHIYAVDDGNRKSYTVKGGVRITPTVTQGSSKWLTLHTFTDTQRCIDALRADGCTIWATYLGPDAHPLTAACTPLPLPPRLAIVMGREVDGVSPAMLAAAERRVFLPQNGFSESFNVSAATALVLQRLLDLCPEAVGEMGEEERRGLRRQWYTALAPTVGMREEYARWVQKGERGELEWTETNLRPREEVRVPRMTRKQRLRMIEAGHREVIVHKPTAAGGGGAEPAVEEERKSVAPPVRPP